jgi:hypothetical protein
MSRYVSCVVACLGVSCLASLDIEASGPHWMVAGSDWLRARWPRAEAGCDCVRSDLSTRR